MPMLITHADRDELSTTLWDVVAKVRDEYPRRADDAPSEEIVNAILDKLQERRLLVVEED